MFLGKVEKKLSDTLTSPIKSEYLKDLSLLSKPALLENLQRQEKILSNRPFIAKLPDKGAKIEEMRNRLAKELHRRENDMVEAMSGLSLKSNIIEELEWKGNCEVENINKNDDSDEKNPFKILVSHNSSNKNKKIYRVEAFPETFIYSENPSSNGEILSNVMENDYAIHLCRKFGEIKEKERFLPHKTLHTKTEKKKECLPRVLDLSAASPPISVYGSLKFVSLEESISIQIKQAKELGEIQLKHAIERLKDRAHLLGDILPSVETAVYREPVQHGEMDSEDDDLEDYDNKESY